MKRVTWLAFGLIITLICVGLSVTAQENSGQQTDKVYKASEVTRKVWIISKPDPEYTQEAREKKVEGKVRLRLVMGSSGKVRAEEVLMGLTEGLTEKAIDAARRIEFEPAVKDGRPVSQYVTVEYEFSLEKKGEKQ